MKGWREIERERRKKGGKGKRVSCLGEEEEEREKEKWLMWLMTGVGGDISGGSARQ